MLLCASKTAQFFIEEEFYLLEIMSDELVLRSIRGAVHVPFSDWNGVVTVKRGLVWASIYINGYSNGSSGDNNEQKVWVVQGLPWHECQTAVTKMVNHYKQWHLTLCRKLNLYLPKWSEKLQLLESQPRFLRHSQIDSWREMVASDLNEAGISLEEAKKRVPDQLHAITEWISTPELLHKRNLKWLEIEKDNWQVLFAQLEGSPLNDSQQKAVLLDDDHNLVLAGAGSGKTSVITARVAYSIQSRQADASEILILAFGKNAAIEMQQRLEQKLGSVSDEIQVNTFHQLSMHILRQVHGEAPKLTPLATNLGQKKAWFTQWLKDHWTTDTNFKRWQKHLSQWPIAFLTGDDELGAQTANPKLLAWLEQQVDQLCSLALKKKNIQEQLVKSIDYPRLNSELQLCWPCYQAWLKMLKEERSVDFNSMITSATHLVNSGKFKPTWRKVMVDEYQDISPDRLELLKAISKTNKEGETPSVFAVGDDWQSIYQFAGSQIDLTTGFQSLFTHASVHALDRTYRCNSQITEVANKFIQQNPSQLSKSMTSQVNQENCAVFTLDEANLDLLLTKMNRECKLPESVLLLGRNHYHKPKDLKLWQQKFAQLKLEFLTCHASKGQEADNVIILSCNEKEFPPKQRTQHLREYLTSSTDQFEHAEERRLFYVALTRAKRNVYIAHGGSPSTFVNELKNGDYNINTLGGRTLAK